MRSSQKFLNKFHKSKSKGFGLIEIIIGSAILTVSLIAISTYFQKSLQLSQDSGKTVQAGFLLEEGVEVVKFFRDTSWVNISGLTAGTSYYLQFDGTKWATTSSNVFVDGIFERKFVLTNVYRDGNDDIAPTGTLDLNTKKAVITLAWNNGLATTSKSLEFYLTNFFGD